MKILVLILFILTASHRSYSQIPPLDSLESSLKAYYYQSWQAEREEFIVNQHGRILNYIPSFGITLGLPTVNFNTNKIYDYAYERKVRKHKLKSVDSQYKVRYNEDLNNLRIEYQKIIAESNYLNSLLRMSNLKKQEFEIYQEAYNKMEMKPVDYLNKCYEYESYVNSVARMKMDFEIKLLELKKLARYQMANDILDPAFENKLVTENR